MEEIKKVLDMGFEIHSPNFRLNKTNWGTENEFEYALTDKNGRCKICITHYGLRSRWR